MRSLVFAARIRIRYKCAIKERVESPIQRMMQKSVAYTRLMYIARLWVCNSKMIIAAMRIVAGEKIVMKHQNMVHQILFKLLYVGSVPFPA